MPAHGALPAVAVSVAVPEAQAAAVAVSADAAAVTAAIGTPAIESFGTRKIFRPKSLVAELTEP